jgi:hypothetical protein
MGLVMVLLEVYLFVDGNNLLYAEWINVVVNIRIVQILRKIETIQFN